MLLSVHDSISLNVCFWRASRKKLTIGALGSSSERILNFPPLDKEILEGVTAETLRSNLLFNNYLI